jgi:hypothetical protein
MHRCAFVTLSNSSEEVTVALSDFVPGAMVTLPRPYPTFVPYYFEPSKKSQLNISALESIQISIGPGLEGSSVEEPHRIAIESVSLH